MNQYSGEVLLQIGWLTPFRLRTPFVNDALTVFLWQVSQNDVTCGCMHQVDFGANLNIEPCGRRRIYLSQYDHMAAVNHSQMAGLPQFVGKPVHSRQGFHNQTFGWRMFLRQTKQSKREVIPLFIRRLSQVPTLLQTKNHAEDL